MARSKGHFRAMSKFDVNIKGLPPGATATATTSGDATGGVSIHRAMP